MCAKDLLGFCFRSDEAASKPFKCWRFGDWMEGSLASRFTLLGEFVTELPFTRDSSFFSVHAGMHHHRHIVSFATVVPMDLAASAYG
eukprot:2231989-Amphidinium_carterae.1